MTDGTVHPPGAAPGPGAAVCLVEEDEPSWTVPK
ncbi:hypothetical protein Ae168Ps1_2407 [Pseudonocardia sp. Ae168_Ps1]|nr:hypothetical protein Ae168Ps1_2407 [Pseudonocardia sp. Ae168_Ps1]